MIQEQLTNPISLSTVEQRKKSQGFCFDLRKIDEKKRKLQEKKWHSPDNQQGLNPAEVLNPLPPPFLSSLSNIFHIFPHSPIRLWQRQRRKINSPMCKCILI
jgi:hypothetical protein